MYKYAGNEKLTVFDPGEGTLAVSGNPLPTKVTEVTHIGKKGLNAEGECISECEVFRKEFEAKHPTYAQSPLFKRAINANPCLMRDAKFRVATSKELFDGDGYVTDDRLVAMTTDIKLAKWKETVTFFVDAVRRARADETFLSGGQPKKSEYFRL